MAKSKSRRKGRKTRRPTKAEIKRQKALERFILAIVTTVIFFFAMARLGIFGITVYNLVRLAVGSLAYVLMVAVLLYFLGFKWFHKQAGLIGGFVVTMIGLLLEWHAYLFSLSAFRGKEIFSTTASLIFSDLVKFKVTKFVGGGMLGAVLYKPVAFLFSNVGTFLIGGLFIILGLFLMSPWEVYDLIDFFKEKSQEWAAKHEIRKQKRFVKREEKRALAEQKRQEKAQKAEEERLAQLTVDQETGEILDGPDDNEASIFDNILVENAAVEPEILAYEHVSEGLEETASEENLKPEVTPAEEEMIDQEDDGEPLEVDFTAKANLLYKLPTIDLFAPDKPKNQSKEKNIVRRNIKVLEDTFNSFGIDVKVERAEIGPSVTKYEVKPAVGVRVNRISNLADDLALALAAKDVRIEAPIPGKSLVGIEVPNSEIATVTFRELWEQADTDPNKLLEVPLGKAVNGTARTFDLARMPHLLVAGSTGSGKSVAVNGIIASILMKARPDQVKFMMIDPKMVELSVYNDIPHLLIPVVTNPRKAARALQKVVDEMENRYELFSHFGVRNIAGYNAKVEEFNAQSEQKQIPLPLIVVIVDELADLMMVASKEVEDAIIRLGQKARAAGIHMILATQRPSVDVISGLIKANVPSRVAFAVSSGTDSRTILDENGAEKLLGRGDMLFKPIDENHPVRLQGSFISDDDVERIVGFIKNQADADYDDSFDPGEVSESDLKSGGGGASQEGDPLFEDAKALVLETQKASASMLQRRLSVGFNRATRLMDELEAAGVIGPAEGTKPRKVLMTKPTPEA
ncbi:DNA translocase, DnaK family [Streptococcus infantarius subsp. infantarius]|uniref:DNA translocase FtsK n=1 Tax=uncultured Streptococcus sp. TaxID=83427 RepID=UPI00208F1A1F|nr:DNA translocase FtsK [uncultured Streptococcus sp.]MCO4521099.1 DNA translocase, DnaK family [Streptococcus infantarius subsp. infantarius]MCO4530555.1 DNA translocase, DnaK family [Streptococcus infantarius subsp. infantarius]MCO4534814.1 DNA translocase, DnaK family [Streptococcus infantarius subsp. infantarius]MCO4536357.1 DNA translocase, DnaK family [Streptococcus infantarius subsp. infantarius]MCO4586104.1 DNA translocase, DnaK family [Streptococcus infantarius subsp. infantarius]